ncbi:MAG TPA: methyltransferase domain-containing protein [Vicinamibacterales bacterium]|nr:methyltransferase domain-containing protein [Vicinamibacterales bacterium]
MIVQDPERHEVDALTALMPAQPARVVEIGCGDGRLTCRYADTVRSVLAIDPDERAVAGFRAMPPPSNVDLRAIAIDRLDLAAGAADVVLLSWSL